jgi:hypothetical protein
MAWQAPKAATLGVANLGRIDRPDLGTVGFPAMDPWVVHRPSPCSLHYLADSPPQ